MGEKQHFVPQFLLRNFSDNLDDLDKKSLSIYNIRSRKLIINGSLKEQAYKKNIYGADQKFENYLADIESESSVIISKIIKYENLDLDEKDNISLKHFINMQISRTPEKVNSIQSQFDKIVKTAYRYTKDNEKIITKLKSKQKNQYESMIILASDTTPILFDLKFGLLKNETEIPFILGEHPSIVLNPFLCERKWIGSKQGIANKGAVIILPLSPKYMLVLYDNLRYSFANYHEIGLVNLEDVNKLNQFQFCYTKNNIFCSSKILQSTLNNYADNTKEFRNNDKGTMQIYKGKHTKKEKTELLILSTKEPPVSQSFGFIKIKRNAFFEDLGDTMDVSRDVIKRFIRKKTVDRHTINLS